LTENPCSETGVRDAVTMLPIGNISRVRRQPCGCPLPSEPDVKVVPSSGSSPHKANPYSGPTRSLSACSARPLGNTHVRPSQAVLLQHQLRDAPTDGRRSSFAFPIGKLGSTYFLTLSDQTDVGVSSTLHAGIGFFGHPKAAPHDPPCGEVCSARSRARLAAFPCSARFTG
jgi:hypothetical protein